MSLLLPQTFLRSYLNYRHPVNQLYSPRYLLTGIKDEFYILARVGGNFWDAVVCFDCTDYNVFLNDCRLRILG